MEGKGRKNLKEGFRAAWQALCWGLAALLLLDFLVCLIAALLATDWLLGQFEAAAFTAALLLLGIIAFLPARRLGAGKLPRRLLGAGLIGGGLVVVFYCVAYVSMFLQVVRAG